MAGPGVSASDIGMIRDLAYVSGLRGGHGTGVLQGKATKKDFKLRIRKLAEDISYFLWFHSSQKGGDDKILDDIFDNLFVGHVRYATKGEITEKNSHPFDTGRFVGAHNGTLRDKRYEDEKKTDSEMMFTDMETRGVSRVLKDLDDSSAYAVTMFDKRTKELIIARNYKRPLCYAWNLERRVLYWASEKLMLEFAALRNGVKLSTIYKFTEEMIYSFRPEEIEANKTPKWRTENIKKPVVPVVTHTVHSEHSPWSYANRSNRTDLLEPLPGEKSNVLRLPGPVERNYSITSVIKPAELTRVKTNKLQVDCIHCMRVMDLFDQYKGTEVDVGIYSCEECDLLVTEMAKRNEQGRLH